MAKRGADTSPTLTAKDVDYIARVVQTEIGTLDFAKRQGLSEEQYSDMAKGVVDTIINRIGSPSYPGTTIGVIDQWKQFSAINSPLEEAVGSVRNAPKADELVNKIVERHVAGRAAGKPSSIGPRTDYLNIASSDKFGKGWGATMRDPMQIGVPGYNHTHGTADWVTQPEYMNINAGSVFNPSRMDFLGLGYSTSPKDYPGTEKRGRLSSEYVNPNAPKEQQSLVRPTGPAVVGMPRNPLFPDRVTKPTPRPNVAPPVNPAEIQRMKDNLAGKMAFALPNPSNMNVSGYGFSTPAKPSGAANPGRGTINPPNVVPASANVLSNFDENGRWTGGAKPSAPSVRGSATGSIGRASATGSASVPERASSVAGGRGNINPPNVVADPINVLSNFDQYGNFTGNRQSSAAPTSDFRSTLQERAAVPQRSVSAPNPTAFETGPTSSQSVRDAQAGLAKSNQRDQFARDILKGIEVDLAPIAQPGGRISAPPSGTPGNMGSAGYGPAQFDAIDLPGSALPAPQVTAPALVQTAPVAPVQPQAPAATVAPQAPSVTVPGPVSATPQSITDAAKGRFDAARPGVYQGIPPNDIYDQNAPGRSGFRGFGAGGFLGNLLTGNAGNMAGIDRSGGRGINVLGALLGAALGGVPGAAIGAFGPAIMGGIGRGGEGQSRGGDGTLSPGAVSAGWAGNNPEFSYGGYGSGYDPTPR